jgi:NodT family efflux transporter outer membrane factor (OMF) lipoprotein
VGPDYVRPATPEGVGWHAPLAGGLAAVPADKAVLATFWQTLGDPQLDSLVARAIAANLDVQAAQARLRQARAQRQVALGAFVPTITGNGSTSRTHNSTNGNTVRASDFGRSFSRNRVLYNAGLDASWEIDLFGGLRRGLEAANAERDAAQEDVRDTLVSLLAELATNYVDVRATQARLRIAEANLASQSETFDLTNWRAQAGLTTELDVEQARTSLATTRAAVPTLRAQLEAAENRLAVLLARPPGALAAELAEPKPVPATPREVAVGVPGETLAQRPDVRRAEQQLHAETARVGVQKAAAYPSLDLLGSIGLEALSPGGLFKAGATTAGATASVAQTIFDGGQISGNVHAQEAVREQSLAAYQSAVLTALEEVENALVAFAQEQDRRQALADGATAAERALKLAQDQYNSGLIDFQTVLDAQRSLYTLQDQLAQSDGQVTSNLVRLYKALGGGWTPETTS